MREPRRRLALILLLLGPGCALGTTARWRAGGPTGPLGGTPGDGGDRVAVHYKEDFGPLEEVESRRGYMCGTTTVLRKAFLLESPAGRADPPARDYEVVGHVTTEEFPRDPSASRIEGDELFSVLGVGGDAFDLFEVRLDPAFRDDALQRLRAYARAAGADGVVEVFATGEAEHHMWHGDRVGVDPAATDSPVYVNLRLLGFELRDVRLHGTAVRFE